MAARGRVGRECSDADPCGGSPVERHRFETELEARIRTIIVPASACDDCLSPMNNFTLRDSSMKRESAVQIVTLLTSLLLAVSSGAIVVGEETLERTAVGVNSRHYSGIYPHLASFNSGAECGTGAVVPWAGKLWWISYSPHMPNGSDDKLYAADTSLDFFTWSGSVGGTPANRMIHRESQQLLIGPYLIDRDGQIRVISPVRMRGRLTGNARHLTDPANKVYYATMEEGFYEVDVRTLQVTELFPDANFTENDAGDLLPGYHGKGLYSGQGRLVYANNGEKSSLAMTRPDIPAGALAQWSGQGGWQVILRQQFTEVTGPGGIHGNDRPATDPIWSIGWDHRSLILMLCDGGQWQRFRLPKASHCYDGAHGWNTEWPRIRAIGEPDLLMTMHGMFWRFPRSWRQGQSAGIAPRSTYLKVIGDFCRWNDTLVFGCDDAAKNEFLNTRKAKGKVAGPVESQSNLWFVEPSQLDRFGPALGRGAVWIDEPVEAHEPSDAFLFSGFATRSVHLVHQAGQPVTFRLETDRVGDGNWTLLEEVTVPAAGYAWHPFREDQAGAWIRAQVSVDCQATVWFEMRNRDARPSSVHGAAEPLDPRFAGLSLAGASHAAGGLVRAGDRDTGLNFLATRVADGKSQPVGYYELKPDLSLVRVDDDRAQQRLAGEVAVPTGVLRVDDNCVVYVDDDGQRYRLPIGNPVYREHPELMDLQRTSREVTTERDLFQCAGTFYELPARNAGGFAKIRPIATHPLFLQDYCSWRGLLVLSGVAAGDHLANSHVVRSSDGFAAVWLGAVDDLWALGKPVGRGGPWTRSQVHSDEPSDPYLLAGYDQKRLTLSHDAGTPITFRLEVDISGTGNWHTYQTLDVPARDQTEFEFPPEFHAYWVRLVASDSCLATAEFVYE